MSRQTKGILSKAHSKKVQPAARSLFSKVYIYVGYALVIIPIIVLAIWVFVGRWAWPDLIPQFFNLRAVNELFGPHARALNVLGSSILLSIAVALIAILVSLPAARVLALAQFPGRRFLKNAVLLPVIVPATAFAMGVHILFIPLGLIDTVGGVLLIHVILCIPYTVRILTEVTQATGDGLEVQAFTLGASNFKTFMEITIPTAMPGIVSSACMAFIVSFSQYFVTLLIGGGRVMTYALFMFPYISSGDRSIAAIYSVVFIISSMTVFIIFDQLARRYYHIDDVVFFG
jgi:putative spermidine/putrescine transport system permease protein